MYDIVPYSADLDAQIAELQTHLWSGEPALNDAYLRWKYFENPFLRDVLIRVALSEGRAVAMRGLFGAAWEVDGPHSRFVLPHADDLVVASQYRNRGIARHVMRATLAAGADRGFPYAVSLGAGSVTLVSSLADGWRAAGSFRSAWYTARPTRGAASSGRTLFDRLDGSAGQSGGPMSLAAEPRPVDMAALVARLPWDGRIRHVRDAAYLSWRFRNPLHEYRFLFWNDGGLQGYLVLQRYRSERADRHCVNIVDWEAASEHVRAGLLRAALAWGRFARVQVWTAGADASQRRLLRAEGFADAEPSSVRTRSSALLVHRLETARPDQTWKLGRRNLLDVEDWDLRMLYSMVG